MSTGTASLCGVRRGRWSLAPALALLALCVGGGPAAAAEWPHWRGPDRDGSSPDAELVRGWLERGLETCWRRPLGEGYAGVAVAGGRVYTMDSRGTDEFVVALSAADGRELWRTRSGRSPRDVWGGYGPRVMPTLAGGELFTLSGEGVLLALDAESGRELWRRDLRRLGGRGPAEGYSSSPLVWGDRVLVLLGGKDGKTLAALDRASGKLLWSSQDDGPSYSSPLPWTFAGVDQALFLTASELYSVRPESGELLWRYDWPTYDSVNVATPLVIPPDRVFISAGYDQGGALLRVSKAGRGLRVEEVWRNREMKNHFNSSVHHRGAIYGFDEGILKAIDAASGEELWKARGFGKGSLILAAGHLIVLSDDGELALAAADRRGFEPKARLEALDGRTWTPPSLADGRLYLRGRSEVVCLKPG